MMGTLVRQCLRGATPEQIKAMGAADYYVDHNDGVFPCSPSGEPWTAAYIQVKGDPVVDLTNDMAAEQKARATYESILRLTDDPDIMAPIRFLREREIVHFQRFGEALNIVQGMNKKPCCC